VNVVHPGDGPVAIQRDGNQMKDRRRAAENVERRPRVTPTPAEEPARTDLIHGCQRHDQRRNKQISDRQGRYQVVGDVVALIFEEKLVTAKRNLGKK